jgi:hypothetical protein
LAEPTKQWKTGYSARTLAHCWEAANGLPSEIEKLIRTYADFASNTLELLAAFPEWHVSLPGGRRSSQSDVFALVKMGTARIAMTVEGKVNEPFGPTLSEWLVAPSDGKKERLKYLSSKLGSASELPGSLRYQLLHRSASALIEADRFGADHAAMVVHSFSPDHAWFSDFAAFCDIFGIAAEVGMLHRVTERLPVPLYLGWAAGDARFLSA